MGYIVINDLDKKKVYTSSNKLFLKEKYKCESMTNKWEEKSAMNNTRIIGRFTSQTKQLSQCFNKLCRIMLIYFIMMTEKIMTIVMFFITWCDNQVFSKKCEMYSEII